MSRTDPRAIEAIALETPCSYCGQACADWCITDTGVWAPLLHASRTHPAYCAHSMGYREAQDDVREQVQKYNTEQLLAWQLRVQQGRFW